MTSTGRTRRRLRQHRSDVRRCIRWLVRMGRVRRSGWDMPMLREPCGPDAFADACSRVFDFAMAASYGRVTHRANKASWIKCTRCEKTHGQDPDAYFLTHNPMTGEPTGHDGMCEMCGGDGGWEPGKCSIRLVAEVWFA